MSTDPWPLCGDCSNFRDGLCYAAAWADWPERDPEDEACSEFVEATS